MTVFVKFKKPNRQEKDAGGTVRINPKQVVAVEEVYTEGQNRTRIHVTGAVGYFIVDTPIDIVEASLNAAGL